MELAKPEVGAVGGVFYGKRGNGLIGALQRAEYVRYARQVARNGGRAYVLTGTATAFTAKVLREIAARRADGSLPPGPGAYYDERTRNLMTYKPSVGGIGAGTLGTGAIATMTWGNAGWLLMAAFVLVMAGVAVLTIVPRRRAAMRHVNPPAVR